MNAENTDKSVVQTEPVVLDIPKELVREKPKANEEPKVEVKGEPKPVGN